MRPKAILLDLDDTIIAFDHGLDLNQIWLSVCSSHLPDFNENQILDVISCIRECAMWYWSDPDRHRIGRLDLDKARTEIVAHAMRKLDLPYSTILCECIAADYGQQRDEAVTLYPRSLETLEFLRSAGIKLALLTNGSSVGQRRKIDRFNLTPYFDCIVIEEEFGIGKPHDRVYLHALMRLGVEPEDAWIIGDNFEWEVIAPQALGIKAFWLNHKGIEPSQEITPFQMITALSDILEHLN